MSKREWESDTVEGAFESFAVKNGRGTHKLVARPVVAYEQGFPGQTRRRQRLQKIPGNLGACQRKAGLGRSGSRRGWHQAGRSREGVGAGWSRMRA